MQFLSDPKIEAVAPATYRVWPQPGGSQVLRTAFFIALPLTFVLALEHRYLQMALLWLMAILVALLSVLMARRKAGRPPLELVDDVLSVQAPGRVEKISLAQLRSVTITGPRKGRDWIFYFKDGSKKDFRPHLSRGMDQAVVTVLREVSAGRFEVTVEPPLFLEL